MKQEISGCGPGISRSPDTPQHGIRSIPCSRADYLARLNVEMDKIVELWNVIDDGPSNLAALAFALQRAADAAMAVTTKGV